MVNIQQYPPEVRERALQLVDEGNSYSRVVQKLKEEFGEKYPEVEKISKSTIYRWMSQHKKQEKTKKEQEEKKEEPEVAEPLAEEAKAPASDKLPAQLENLPKIHPDQVVSDLNKEVTEVPPGQLTQSAEGADKNVKDGQEAGKESTIDKIKKLDFLKSKLFWSITATLIIGAIILWLIKRHTSRPEQEAEEEEQEEKPVQKKSEDYLEVKPDEEKDEAISALDLPF